MLWAPGATPISSYSSLAAARSRVSSSGSTNPPGNRHWKVGSAACRPDQAINRAHRIGTAGPVTVTRFLSVGTIEERINQILEEKREIFDTIFADGGAAPKNLGLSQDEIFGLFDLRTPQGPIDAAA